MFREYDFKRYDFLLIVLVIALVSFGIVAINSATSSIINVTDIFVNKQIIGFGTGIIIMVVVSLIDYRFIAKFYWVIYLVNILLLVAVLAIGHAANNAVRWINIGGFTLQPSEFSKVFITIFLAKWMDRYKSHINKPWFWVLTAGLVMVPVYLIQKQPNLSTSLVLVAILGAVIFVGGIKYKYVIIGISIFIPLLVFILWYIQQPDQSLLEPYQVQRIMTLLYPDRATVSQRMQTENSIQAIGSGQLFGKGLFQGKLNKYNYLPEPQTDFIFSIIGEEFGFVGCSAVLALIFLIALRCLWIAKDVKDAIARIIITGFITVLCFQTFVNVGVVTGILPNTGLPLPFVSYGISSLWSNMIALGLILNISIQRKSLYY